MTLAITGHNVNDTFPQIIRLLRDQGVYSPSRIGPVLEYPEPMSVMLTNARERVLFNQKRNINPYLHFFESFWILAGRRDVAFLSNIVKKFEDYSDDGKTFAAAYGWRMRKPVDQIANAIRRLKVNREDRQVVLQIRTPREILSKSRDVACNTAVMLKIRDSKLNLHLVNRSNDAIWGGPVGGSNVCQFSILQEYLAGHIGCGVGIYTATSDNVHVYTNPQWETIKDIPEDAVHDPYTVGGIQPFQMMQEPNSFDADLFTTFALEDDWKRTSEYKYESLYFNKVYQPMWNSFVAYKEKDLARARLHAGQVAARDWALVTDNWLWVKQDAQKEEKDLQ